MKKYTSYTEKCKEFQKEMLDFFMYQVVGSTGSTLYGGLFLYV